MDHRAPSPLRFVAPLALVAAALVFFLVIAGSLGGSDTESPTSDASPQEDSRGSGGGGEDSGPRTYEVEEGDTLEGIAVDTGVSVERIQELNPDLDPQALVAGEELRLRE